MNDEVISLHAAPSRKIFVVWNQETPPILLTCFLVTEIGDSGSLLSVSLATPEHQRLPAAKEILQV